MLRVKGEKMSLYTFKRKQYTPNISALLKTYQLTHVVLFYTERVHIVSCISIVPTMVTFP